MPTESFGKYVITQTVGKGGMAEVYQGVHPELNRRVAIKVIHPHLSDEETLGERFRREANLIASLRHPHIIHLYDFDVSGSQLYMVMEYLDGGTLKDRLKELRLRGEIMSLPEAGRFLDPLAAALDYAHARGAIHRDIKPANILFTREGEPVITDFGIVKLLGENTQMSLTGGLVGTPSYISPEQAAGGQIGRHSDIYSLAIVVYEMVAGRVPFQGDSITAVLIQQINDPPPAPSSINPKIPPTVEAVILKALAKDPTKRYATAGDFARAFQAAIASQPSAVPPPPVRHDDATLITMTGRPSLAKPPDNATLVTHSGRPGETKAPDPAAVSLAGKTGQGTAAGRTVEQTAAGKTQLQMTLDSAVRTGAPLAIAGVLLLPAVILAILQLTDLSERLPSAVQPVLPIVIFLSFAAAAITALVGVLRGRTWPQRLPSAAAFAGIALLTVGWGAWSLTRDPAANPAATPTPPIQVEAGDFVLAVANFDGSAASRQIDFGRRIYDQLQTELAGVGGEVTIIRIDDIYQDAPAAREAAADSGITLLIWGWYDDAGVSPHVELLQLPELGREVTAVPINLTGDALAEPTLADIVHFTHVPAVIPTFDLFVSDYPRQMVYIAASVLGLTFYTQGQNDQALALFEKAIANAPESSGNGQEILYFHRATIRYQQGRPAESIADLQQALSLKPDFFEAHYNLALAYSEGCATNQQRQQAITEAEAAVQLAPSSAQAHALLGDLYRQQGRYPEAIAELEAAVQLDPADATTLEGLAAAYQRNDQPNEAADTWQQAISLRRAAVAESDLVTAEPHLALGDSLLGAVEYDEALVEYLTAQEIEPENPQVYQALGNVYYWLGRFDEAEEAYRQWIALTPETEAGLTHLLLGLLYLEQERTAEAITELEAAGQQADCDPTPHLLLGGLYWKEGDYQEAADNYEAAVAIDTENADALYLLGATRYFAWDETVQAGNPDDALLAQAAESLERATELQPTPESLHILGQVYFDQAEYTRAAGAWAQLVELQPDVATNYHSLAWAYEKLGFWQQAIEAYQQALELENDAATHLYLAFDYQQLGELEQAIAEYEAALELDPDEYLAYSGLGDLYLQQGQLEQAAEAYQQAIALHEAAWLHAQLGLVYLRQGDNEAALAEYEAAVALDNQDWQSYVQIGFLQSQNIALEEAETAYETAVALNPESVEAHYGLGALAYKECNLSLMEQEMAAATAAAPNASFYQGGLAWAYEANGRTSDAAQLYDRLQTATANDAIAHVLAAGYLYRSGRLEDAQREYQAALAAPNLAPFLGSIAHTGLGRIYYDQGNFTPAHTEYEVALELMPANAEAMFWLGDVPLRNNEPQLALGTYDQALTLIPDYAVQFSAENALLLPIHIQLRRGLALERLGRPDEAAEAFAAAVTLGQQVLTTLPNWPQAHLALAYAYLVLGDTENSQLQLTAASECDQSLTAVWQKIQADLVLLRPVP